MISDFYALTNGISLLDAINETHSKDKEEKSNGIEDIFAEIIDEITENVEKQTEENNKKAEFADNNIKLGPPAGLNIDGFDYYALI